MSVLETALTETPRAPRRRTLFAGIVIHGLAPFTLDCAIRDVSENGARVRLTALAHLANPIVLVAPSLDTAHEAVVAWQNGQDIGLKFVRRVDLQSPTSDLDRITRRLWLERRAR
jgi:hypothetical protein